MYSDGLCVYTELGWLDDPHQFLTDVSSLGASQTTDLGQCVNSAETAMRASYEGCGYTGEDWTRLDALISVSSYVQCTSQMFSQQCELRVRESWHSWLEQSSSSSSSSSSFSSIAPLTTTGSTCEANVQEMLQKISLRYNRYHPLQAGDVCLDTTYGLSKTCCPPFSCISVTNRTSTCQETEGGCDANVGQRYV